MEGGLDAMDWNLQILEEGEATEEWTLPQEIVDSPRRALTLADAQQLAAAAMDTRSLRFLSYLRGMATGESEKDSPASAAPPLSLNWNGMVAAEDKQTIVRLFYQALVLASNSFIVLEQREPWGDIHLQSGSLF